MSKGRLRAKLFFGYALNEANEPTVSMFKLSSNFGQRKTFLLFRHDPIEGIDSAMCDGVSLWLAPFENGRQVLQRLLFPGGHMDEDVPYRPITARNRMTGAASESTPNLAFKIRALVRLFYLRYGRGIGSRPIQDALTTLEAQAVSRRPVGPVRASLVRMG